MNSFLCYTVDPCCFIYFIGSSVYLREGNGNPLQCSCLKNPRDGGAWWAVISGVAQSRTRLKQLSSSSSSSGSSSVYLLIPSLFFLGLILEVSFCFVFLFQSQRQYSKCYFGKKGRQKYSLSISPNYHASQFCVFFFLFISGPSRACPRSPPLPRGEVCLALWLPLVSWGVKYTFLSPYFSQACDLLCFCLGCAMWDLSSLTRDQTPAPSNGCVES